MLKHIIIISLYGFFITSCSESENEHALIDKATNATETANEGKPNTPQAAEEISWDDLIPVDSNPELLLEDFAKKYGDKDFDSNDPMVTEFKEALLGANKASPIVKSLQGKNVKIAGYVLPLNMKGEEATEFLLVPYVGACVHVPPPPANQIIYVAPEKSLEVDGLYDAVWVTGKVVIEQNSTEYAESGYTIVPTLIEPYEIFLSTHRLSTYKAQGRDHDIFPAKNCCHIFSVAS